MQPANRYMAMLFILLGRPILSSLVSAGKNDFVAWGSGVDPESQGIL